MPRTIKHPALDPLKAKFPSIGLKLREFRDMVTVVVPREHILPVCQFLRDDPALHYDLLSDLNGVDYLHFPGATNRFGVNYGLTSIPHNNRLWLKVFLDPTMDTAPGTAPRDEDLLEKGGARSLRPARHHFPKSPRPAANHDLERLWLLSPAKRLPPPRRRRAGEL